MSRADGAVIRTATAADAPQVQALYAAWNYRGRVEPDDAVVVAEHEGRIIGVVRLAPEHGTTVLRGMRVEPAYQHQGLGSRMHTWSDSMGRSVSPSARRKRARDSWRSDWRATGRG